jgi:hypothetical protein
LLADSRYINKLCASLPYRQAIGPKMLFIAGATRSEVSVTVNAEKPLITLTLQLTLSTKLFKRPHLLVRIEVPNIKFTQRKTLLQCSYWWFL